MSARPSVTSWKPKGSSRAAASSLPACAAWRITLIPMVPWLSSGPPAPAASCKGKTIGHGQRPIYCAGTSGPNRISGLGGNDKSSAAPGTTSRRRRRQQHWSSGGAGTTPSPRRRQRQRGRRPGNDKITGDAATTRSPGAEERHSRGRRRHRQARRRTGTTPRPAGRRRHRKLGAGADKARGDDGSDILTLGAGNDSSERRLRGQQQDRRRR